MNSLTPIFRVVRGKGNVHGISGETVNGGTINIDLHVWLVFGEEETGTVYLGKL